MSEAAEARKARKAEYMAEYSQRPEVRVRQAQYIAEYKAKHAARLAEYRRTPEVKARMAESLAKYRQTPESKEWEAEYRRRPEVKARRSEYKRRPEVKEREAKRAKEPEAKARTARYARSLAGWEKRRSADLLRKYGITLDDFRWMVREQGGNCANCRKPLPGWEFDDAKLCDGNHPVVDHCHRTGSGKREAVRGVVHSSCNHITGLQGDDPEIARLNYEYLLRNERPLMQKSPQPSPDAFEGEDKGRPAQVEEKRL